MEIRPVPPAQPLAYRPDYEVPEPEEADTEAKILKTFHRISSITYRNSGHAIRAAHAKSHGLLCGALEVFPDLPEVLAQGLFAKGGNWPVIMRISTIPGDMLEDAISTPRGMAIKVIGVDGPRLAGSEGAITQDFVMVNTPAFIAPSGKRFLDALRILAATTDRFPGFKKVVSAVLKKMEKILELFGMKSEAIKAIGGHPETHVLGETYYSQAPILFGPYMAKVSVAPSSPNLVALTGARINLADRPNGLREAVMEFFSSHTAEWELRVQLCTDIKRMPIEDASVVWPEEVSPFIPVGRIRVEPQPGWSDALSKVIDDGLSFSPWHGILDHRPLGSIMRMRKAAYEMSAHFRAQGNKVIIKEPTDITECPYKF